MNKTILLAFLALAAIVGTGWAVGNSQTDVVDKEQLAQLEKRIEQGIEKYLYFVRLGKVVAEVKEGKITIKQTYRDRCRTRNQTLKKKTILYMSEIDRVEQSPFRSPQNVALVVVNFRFKKRIRDILFKLNLESIKKFKTAPPGYKSPTGPITTPQTFTLGEIGKRKHTILGENNVLSTNLIFGCEGRAYIQLSSSGEGFFFKNNSPKQLFKDIRRYKEVQ